jgi:hypothetical protein
MGVRVREAIIENNQNAQPFEKEIGLLRNACARGLLLFLII